MEAHAPPHDQAFEPKMEQQEGMIEGSLTEGMERRSENGVAKGWKVSYM